MTTHAQKVSWRDVISIHPDCERMPLLEEKPLKLLALDIAEHGQLEPVKLWQGEDGVEYLLDGRNRLDALELLGVQTVTTKRTLAKAVRQETVEGEPHDLVMSLNVHRRHLTTKQKRKQVADYLKANPQWSDRRIAQRAGVDHKTAARIRKELIADGEIPQLETTQGSDGKNRGRKRAGTKKPEATQAATGDEPGEGETVNGVMHEQAATKVHEQTNVEAAEEDPKPVHWRALGKLVAETSSDELVADLIEAVIALVGDLGEEEALEALKGLLAPV